MHSPRPGSGWLQLAKRLQAIAQDGLTYAKDPEDLERHHELRGLAAQLMAEGSGADLERVCALFEREAGPATPKVDVRVAAFRGNGILQVKEPEDGLWTAPGGWADVGESAAEAAVRETREESGYEVRVVRLVALYDRDHHGHSPIPYHVYKAVFLCEVLPGEPVPSVDGAEVGFFAESALLPPSLTRVHRGAGASLFRASAPPGAASGL